MAKNNTYSVLNGDVVTNGYYSIRYVMENGSPRYALCDFFISLGYLSPYSKASSLRKSMKLGKIVNERDQLMIYVTREEAESVMSHMYYMTSDFLSFWKTKVIPETDYVYGDLRENMKKLDDLNKTLSRINLKLYSDNNKKDSEILELKTRTEKLLKLLEAVV